MTDHRYDRDGRAFIIYCDFWYFVPRPRIKGGVTRQNATFWVCDGLVQKAAKRRQHLEKVDVETLVREMLKNDYFLIDILEH